MKMKNIFATIEKYEKLDDDIIIVSGIASSEAVDNQNEIVKAEAMKDAIPDYLALGGTGALREMHQSKAAGTVFKADVMADGRTFIEAKVVDKEACKKIEQGVYKGFSIGGKVLKKEGNLITKVKLTEISLVDRPCNPEALFNMYKCDDAEDIEKIAERKDVNPKEGESKYGDVKFADEKNNKYPIDTEAHIRAAWNYIHQKRNAAKYSAGDAAKIRGKIVSAWKRVIGGTPPAAEAKKYYNDTPMNQSLGLNLISRLSCIIESLQGLQVCAAYEEELEMDESTLPDEISVAISNLYDILVRMAQEEFAEFNEYNQEINMSDNINDLSKAYDAAEAKSALSTAIATNVNTQQPHTFDSVTSEVKQQQSEQIKIKAEDEMFGAMKRMLVERGYITDAQIIKPVEATPWGEKSEKTEDLNKVVSDMTAQISSLTDKLEKLENQPLQTKGALKDVSDRAYSVISKSEDFSGKQLAKVDRSCFEQFELKDDELTAMDVIKSMHAQKI